MNVYHTKNTGANRKIIENTNYHETKGNKNQRTTKISFKERKKIIIILNNSEEEREKSILQIGNKKIKNDYDKIAKKYRKKTLINKLSKAQTYFVIKFRRLYFLLYIIELFLNMFFFFCKYNQRSILSNLSEVTLKVNTTESGNIKLFSDDFFRIYNHCEIYLNDSLFKMNINAYYSYSNNSKCINIFKIIWNDTILTTKNMFENCNKIIEIDFSNFDTSKISNMNGMFYNCQEMISINLSAFNTSLVNDMGYMFYNCKKLNPLYLSNFNTSEVSSMISMFYGCSSFTSLDLSNFDTSKVTTMSSMFRGCSLLKSIDLSNFDTSKVSSMSSMFRGCKSIISLDLSNFDSSKVSSMSSMFRGCKSIISLDLSNFDTSKVNNMSYMFSYCKFNPLNLSNFDTSKVENMDGMFSHSNFEILDLSNLNTSKVISMSYMFSNTSYNSLNLSNFNTSNVKNMSCMFSNCSSLSSLDLSNFATSQVTNISSIFYQCSNLTILNISSINTSNVVDMNSMFFNCTSINSLDLSNFDTSKVQNMNNMFQGCSLISSLNLSNFETSRVTNMSNMFLGCLLLASLDLSNFDTSEVKNMSYMFYNCNNLSLINLSNFDTSNVVDMEHMFYNCSLIKVLDLSNFNTTTVLNFNNMFYGCINLEYINLDLSNINQNSSIDDMFSFTPDNLKVCFDNNVYKFIESLPETKKYQCNNSYHENKYICYMKNSSLDNEYICDICLNKFSINYMELKDNNTHSICYESEDEHYNHTEFTDEIFYESSKLTFNFINHYNNDIIYIHNDTDIISYNSELSLKSEKYQYFENYSSEIIIDSVTNIIIQIEKNETIKHIIDNLVKEFDTKEIDSGKDKKIINQNKTIILTSTQNQKNNEEENYITMDLGECENILKSYYNISKTNSLYILQIISEEGMKIPKVEYEVYYPLYNSNNLTKLNLSLCKDSKIEVSISVQIDDDLDKYDPKSDYYNDICSKATSDSGTDISLKDRKNEFVNNNMSLCEENCELIGYNHTKGKVKCSCDVKLNIPPNYDSKFDKKDFLKSFTDIENILNINIMKCYKTVLRLNSLIKNYGFIIVGFIIALYFFSLFTFIAVSFNIIKKEIYNIMFSSNIKGNPKKKKNSKNKKKIKEKYLSKKDILDNENKSNKLKLNEKNVNKLNYQGQLTLNIIKQSYNKMNKQKYSINNMNNKYLYNIFKLKDFEMNSLSYEKALKFDHRNYCQYYISLLKYNHSILFSFGCYNDYNSKIIKIFLFFFSFCLDFTINALFFTDDTMHKIYEDKGKFNFLYQIPQILYSTLISRFIDSFIRKFALTQDNIIELKQERAKIFIEQKIKKLLYILKCKFIIFFITTFMILLFLWYYITCFCGIYINTQIHLIKDTIISLITSLLIPFALYTIPGIFRICSLKVESSSRKILYNFSSFIENWLC